MLTTGIIKLRQIDELVKGAQPGDHFFFHCTQYPHYFHAYVSNGSCLDSGHSGQVTNRTNSEEDGMDEGACHPSVSLSLLLIFPSLVIISVDGKDLIDNVSAEDRR
jgi:hypothetical protein